MSLDIQEIREYLEKRHSMNVEIEQVKQLGGEATGAAAIKQYGYGHPLLISYCVENRREEVVFRYAPCNIFGRERDSDRWSAAWLDYSTFSKLPRHVPALDIVTHFKCGGLQSLQAVDDVLLVTAYRPGVPYAEDLARIRDGGEVRDIDVQRAESLATYLAQIHKVKRDDPALWRRRLRDLIGHGEGIMGLTDSYSVSKTFVSDEELCRIEEMANRWRWKLKPLSHRLSQVHGDFHPFNVIFAQDTEFYLLDRSRGEWGEPADDVSCMSINYIFFSLQRSGRFEGGFRVLHDRFWETYLSHHPDDEIMTVIQPWFAWRVLVLASPLWYPTISEEIRRMLLSFAIRVMSEDCYDYREVIRYLEFTS